MPDDLTKPPTHPTLRERWQPTRGGLVNLFKYEDQVFRYENGHLLLRGNNGSGKSRVLALQLPFLFDGEVSPSRVEPDRDSAKRMEWNLLMDQHERRTGYTWIEFGRRDPDTGEAHFLTLGCGLAARRGGGAPDRWYFITRARIGIDLELMTPQRVPLGKKALGDALEEFGEARMFAKASEYRTAVDDALFKLGARYGPLIDLLIQLRQPQLTRDIKEEQLSAALTEALPPVPDALINQVAESFQGLDADRQRTESQREMLDTVATFHEGYRHYLSVAVRRLCQVVREGHSAFEHANRNRRDIEEQIVTNRSALEAAESSADAARSARDKRGAEIGALRASPEMRSREELESAMRDADEREKEAGTARNDLEKATNHREQATAERERRAADRERSEEKLDAAHRSLTSQQHDLLDREPFDWRESDPAAEKKRTNEALAARSKAVALIEKRNAEIGAREQAHSTERSNRDRCAGSVASAETRLGGTRAALSAETETYGEAVGRWERGLRELEFEPGRTWGEALATWLEEREGEFAFATELRSARDEKSRQLAELAAELKAQRSEMEARKGDLAAELDELRKGRQPEPPPRHTRAERDTTREGAPFWKWFEFRDEVPADEHVGWEAALESAGLLDAWVFPDGSLAQLPQDDDFLTATATGDELEVAGSLAAVLKPSGNVSAGVAALLRRIGNRRDSSGCWVDRHGNWANGPHAGHWHKDSAEFLGHRAREVARLARIAALEAELEQIGTELAKIAEQVGALSEREQMLDAEVQAAPDTRKAVEISTRLELERERLTEAKEQLIEAEGALTRATEALQKSIAERDRDAADLSLSEHAEPEALAAFRNRLDEFRQTCSSFWPSWQRCLDLLEQLAVAGQREHDALAHEAEMRSRSTERQSQADRARARADTLKASVGATVEELLARLKAAEVARSSADADLKSAAEAAEKAKIEGAVLEEKLEAASLQRESAVGSRDRAVERMGDYVAHGLLREIDPRFDPDRAIFSATAAVDLARRMEQELKRFDHSDEQWGRLQAGIATRFNELSDALGRHGHTPQLGVIDGAHASVSVVRCEFQGQPRGTRELGEIFAAELEHHERVFEEREREIIENHLIGEAAMQLQQRIRSGENWVREVNEQLTGATTSSGMQLKFDWRVREDEDDELKPVRQLFLKTTAALTPDERETVGRFLHGRIRAERDADDTLPWREHLARALDYRSWHRFGVLRRDGSGREWKKLTRRVFGTGSGGEKAQTLTIPQFAAAAAHYKSADPHAPRLILLDEVFVGIDAPARSRMMGLLETFDLDYVMTSESEWGTHPTVSALAIYQLATRQGFSAVAVTRWVWNGSEKIRDDSDDTGHG